MEPATYRERELFGSPRLPILTGVYELERDHEPHAHDFVEIAILSAGSGYHVTAGGPVAAGPGDVFVLRPGSWHSFAGCRGLVVANCCLGAGTLARDLVTLREFPELAALLWTGPITAGRQGVLATSVPVATAERTTADLRRLGSDLARPDTNRLQLLSQLVSILGRLAGPGTAPGTAGIATSGRTPAVDAVLRAVEATPEHPWTAGDLAGLVNLSPDYLVRLFRRHVGLPPLGYLTRIRIERAASLLTQTELAVAEIGAAVGWPDPNYFARRFRQESGLSPTAYRRAARTASLPSHRGDLHDRLDAARR